MGEIKIASVVLILLLMLRDEYKSELYSITLYVQFWLVLGFFSVYNFF